MENFNELKSTDLFDISGGCFWCKAGATLITIGGVVASGCNPVAFGLAIPALIFTWAC